jgi:hypothetical protein
MQQAVLDIYKACLAHSNLWCFLKKRDTSVCATSGVLKFGKETANLEEKAM